MNTTESSSTGGYESNAMVMEDYGTPVSVYYAKGRATSRVKSYDEARWEAMRERSNTESRLAKRLAEVRAQVEDNRLEADFDRMKLTEAPQAVLNFMGSPARQVRDPRSPYVLRKLGKKKYK